MVAVGTYEKTIETMMPSECQHSKHLVPEASLQQLKRTLASNDEAWGSDEYRM